VLKTLVTIVAVAGLLVPLSCMSVARPRPSAGASFAAFARRAEAGERLTVVFYGASLTWGANASAPNLTSYRACVADDLERTFPNAHFRFYDAAIGGTGSQLGVFRLERDLLRRKPDLVFLDFSANDDIHTADPETLASYEAIVRRTLLEARCPVVIAVFPFLWNVQQGTTDGMKGRDAHRAIARAYGIPVGDAIVRAQRLVKQGKTTLSDIWPHDGVHPGDAGYRLFADAAWDAFLDGLKRRAVCAPPPRMLHARTYMTSARVRISSLGKLPVGWHLGTPNLTSAWYDALMSRWLDDLAIASNRTQVVDPRTKKKVTVPQKVEPLRARFRGSMVFLFGEKTLKSAPYRVRIDGKVVEHKVRDKTLTEFDASAKPFGGNTHLSQFIATGLDPAVDHTLEIEPLFAADQEQELRLESICVAGGQARVWLSH